MPDSTTAAFSASSTSPPAASSAKSTMCEKSQICSVFLALCRPLSDEADFAIPLQDKRWVGCRQTGSRSSVTTASTASLPRAE